MKALVCGLSCFDDYAQVKAAMEGCGFAVTEVVSSSNSSDVEMHAEAWARSNDIPVTIFDTEKEKRGEESTSMRIGRMLKYCDALIAVWDLHCTGIYHMIEEAGRRGLHVFVHIDQRCQKDFLR